MQAHPAAHVLAVNIGSSSLKFGLYPVHANGQVAAASFTGLIENLQPGGAPQMRLRGAGQNPEPQAIAPERGDALTAALRALERQVRAALQAQPHGQLLAVAHRIVHGGTRFVSPTLLGEPEVKALAAFNPLAPLHQPHNLSGVRACMHAFVGVPQIGCFDTAFHAHLPARETHFALPLAFHEQGVRRYGFHGLSYDYVSRSLLRRSARAQGRLLMAHLGNGASLCGARHGQSVCTTMGFSALDGLMMGTRSGSIDPGVLLYWLAEGWSAERIRTQLYQQSGLLGVSGRSADMRSLRQLALQGDDAARFAIELFTHRLAREAGALTTALRGLDVLAFTGGIGEHDADTRAALCDALGHLGVRMDGAANRAASSGDGPRAIHAEGSAAEVWVVPTDEGRVAAEGAWRVLEAEAG